jgi:hypothetical protein
MEKFRHKLTLRRSGRYPRLDGCAAMPRARRGPVRVPMTVEAYAERTACGELDFLRWTTAMPFADGLTSIV